jgi:hypothetical protein
VLTRDSSHHDPGPDTLGPGADRVTPSGGERKRRRDDCI